MQGHLLGLINREMNEEARQDLETNRSSSEWTIEAKLTWVTWETTRRAWRHTFTKSDRSQEGLSTDVNDCWPAHMDRYLVSKSLAVTRGQLGPNLLTRIIVCWSWKLFVRDLIWKSERVDSEATWFLLRRFVVVHLRLIAMLKLKSWMRWRWTKIVELKITFLKLTS